MGSGKESEEMSRIKEPAAAAQHIGHTFIHFSFLVVRFFFLFLIPSLFPLSSQHLMVSHSLSYGKKWIANEKKTARKKTRPSEKCEPINCVFSLFCIWFFFLRSISLSPSLSFAAAAASRFMLFLFSALKKYCIGLCPVPFECVSKMLFILGNMLVRAMHRLSFAARNVSLLCF